MIVVALMIVGAAGVVVSWRLVVAGRVSLFVAQGLWFAAMGAAAVATGHVHLSPRIPWGWAAAAGVGAGVALYLATVTFVVVVRRWSVFERHVDRIYDQRAGLSLASALILAAAVVAPGEELFWRGLFQGRVAEDTPWLAAAVLTWAAYVVVNAASGSLPILAAAVVCGAVWGALAVWTHGVVASIACHTAWTALMVSFPPVRSDRPLHRAGGRGGS